jgi:hypothetical protein
MRFLDRSYLRSTVDIGQDDRQDRGDPSLHRSSDYFPIVVNQSSPARSKACFSNLAAFSYFLEPLYTLLEGLDGQKKLGVNRPLY